MSVGLTGLNVLLVTYCFINFCQSHYGGHDEGTDGGHNRGHDEGHGGLERVVIVSFAIVVGEIVSLLSLTNPVL